MSVKTSSDDYENYATYVVMSVEERRLMADAPPDSVDDRLAHVHDFLMKIENIEKVEEPILDRHGGRTPN